MGKNMTTTTIKEQLHIAESRLTLYYKAEKAILSGQSYEIEGLKLTRANLNMISALESKISALKAQLRGRARFRVVRPGW